MKIQIISDVHLEMLIERNYPDLPVAGDILVLAGDIGYFSDVTHIKWIRDQAKKFDLCIYIAGNHEFYGGDVKDMDYKEGYDEVVPSLYWGHRSLIDYNGLRIAATPGWSYISDYSEWFVKRSINDFHIIKGNTVEAHNARYKADMEFLKEAKADVVITHFAPASFLSKTYKWNEISCFWYSNAYVALDYNPKLWIYGHTHDNFELSDGNTTFVTNALGYRAIEGLSQKEYLKRISYTVEI